MAAEKPIPVLHTVNDGCGDVAFLWVGPVPMQRGTAVRASWVQWPDGQPSQPGELVRCGSCGDPLQGWEVTRMMRRAGVYPWKRGQFGADGDDTEAETE